MNVRNKHLWVIFLLLFLTCGLITMICVVLLIFHPYDLLRGGAAFSPRRFVEGVWVPSENTLKLMQQSGYRFTSHSIQFQTDGTVTITNIPSEWLFRQESSIGDFYSGTASWSLDEETASLKDLRLNLNIVSPSEGNANVSFGTVMDYLQFTPVNNPKQVPWVTFQKCYPYSHISDNSLERLVIALNQSRRDTHGFSPITPKDRIEIGGTIGTTDIQFHAYNDFSSHDIFFRLKDAGYVWVLEQETFTGPEKWVDHDGATWEENIVLQYQTEQINGGPVNGLMVDYTGHDPRLTNRSNNWYLGDNINDVLPILEEWRQWRANEPPSPQSLCP